MDTEQGSNCVPGPPTDTHPAPRRKYIRRSLELPEGMTEEILAWASGVKQSVIYRWKAGAPLNDLARLSILLWQSMGRDSFVSMMREFRNSEPPMNRGRKKQGDQEKETNTPELILEVLKYTDGPVDRKLISELLEVDYGRYTTPESLRTMLWKLKSQGKIISTALGRWTLIAPAKAKTDMPSGPRAIEQEPEQMEPPRQKNETRSGPSENKEEKHGQDHQCSAPRN